MHRLALLLCTTLIFSGHIAGAQTTTDASPTEDPADQVETTGTEGGTEATDADAPSEDEASAEVAGDAVKEIVEAVHKDWQIRCTTGGENCYMYQLARDSRDIPVAEVSIVQVSQGEIAAGVTVMTPLKTFLPQGLQVQVDNGRPQKYQYEFCAEQGCIARFGLSAGGLDQLRRGAKARLTVVSSDNREVPIVLDVSLAGFTAGFADLASR